MGNLVLLHVGAGGRYYEGFINSDRSEINHQGRKIKIDEILELSKPWLHDSESVDGIVGMAVFQQLYWRELVFALREAYRVLKKGGILRMGVPLLENGFPLEHLLGWNNINLFTYELLERVLLNHIGFSSCRLYNYQQSLLPELGKLDNRSDHIFYIEAIK